MVGLDLSHTRLFCHVLFWLTEIVLFSNVSIYSIITCLDPSLPLYFIRLLGSDFFFFLNWDFLRIKLFQKREVILKGKVTALVAPEGFPSCQCVWFHAKKHIQQSATQSLFFCRQSIDFTRIQEEAKYHISTNIWEMYFLYSFI